MSDAADTVPLQAAYTTIKNKLESVPHIWLAVISGGLCALVTLGVAGLAGIPGHGAAVNLEAGQQAVAITSKSMGSYLHVTLDDGLLRSGAKDALGLASHFIMVPLTAETVASLRTAAAATAKLALKWDNVQTTTRSGCNCTGFRNEHGFGAYCKSWEISYQDAWCYVDESCPGGKKGSFGRRHEVCTPEPPPPPKDDFNYSSQFTNPRGEEYVGHWEPPEECPCSGYSSKHGYGAFCKAWEEKLAPHQTPWCYVHENCTASERKKGSFGHKHVDCLYKYKDSYGKSPKPLPQGPIKPKKKPAPRPPTSLSQNTQGFFSKLFGRRLAQRRPAAGGAARRLQQEYPLSRAGRKKERQALRSNEHVAEEVALLQRVASARPRWVALVSAATKGFLSIEAPPHKDALLVHARAAHLDLSSVFALLPSGAIMAAGTNALLTLCEPSDKLPAVCSGFRPNPTDPHRKLLRSEDASKHAVFELKAVGSH